MNLLRQIGPKLKSVFRWFIKRPLIIKIIILGIIIFSGWLITAKLFNNKAKQTAYQTTQAENGTLTIIVSASGQVSSANSASVNTQASGVVSKIFVTNGQLVQTGEKIAELDLDLEGKQRSFQSLASYQNARNSLENTKISYFTLQSDMLTKWKTFMDIAQSSTYQNPDGSPKTEFRQLPQYMSIDDDWLATEAKYKNQENVVGQSQTALNAAWMSYQQTSPIIYAPISGTVTGLALQVGSVLSAQSNTSGTATSQKIASIQTNASPVIQVSLTQIDTPKVKVGNQVTLTFDAFPGQTFTGKVVSIDTIGSISSGVTTYPAVIKLDTEVPNLYSNMTAQANIITQIKDNVLLIPAGAVQTQNGQSSVRVLKNNQIEQVNVETGLSSTTQIEIVSGLSPGEAVVTNTTATNGTGQQRTNQSQSPFGGGFGGGNAIRINR